MHPEARQYVATVVKASGPFGSVLEVGSRDINGGIRDLFHDLHGIDLQPGPGVDEVADVTTWRTGRHFDAVVCCEALEHAPVPEQVVRACVALLSPGGRLILTAASEPRAPHSGIDGLDVRDGEHYANIDPDELSAWLTDLRDVTVEVHAARGDVYATGLR